MEVAFQVSVPWPCQFQQVCSRWQVADWNEDVGSGRFRNHLLILRFSGGRADDADCDIAIRFIVLDVDEIAGKVGGDGDGGEAAFYFIVLVTIIPRSFCFNRGNFKNRRITF